MINSISEIKQFLYQLTDLKNDVSDEDFEEMLETPNYLQYALTAVAILDDDCHKDPVSAQLLHKCVYDDLRFLSEILKEPTQITENKKQIDFTGHYVDALANEINSRIHSRITKGGRRRRRTSKNGLKTLRVKNKRTKHASRLG
jgi:hypothetical protein